MMIPSGRALYEPLFRDVRGALRLRSPDLSISVSFVDNRLQVQDSRAPWARVNVSVASDQRVARRFFVSAILDRPGSEAIEVVKAIRQTVGAVQVYPGQFLTEVRRWSPYQAVDAARNHEAVVTWLVEAIVSLGSTVWSTTGSASGSAVNRMHQVQLAPPAGAPYVALPSEPETGESIEDLVRRKMGVTAPATTGSGRRSTIPSRAPGFVAQGFLVYRLYETGPLKGVGKSLLLVGVYRRASDLVRPDGVRITADDKHLIYSPATVEEGIKSGRCTWSGDQLAAQPGFAIGSKPIPWRSLVDVRTTEAGSGTGSQAGTLSENPALERLYQSLREKESGGVVPESGTEASSARSKAEDPLGPPTEKPRADAIERLTARIRELEAAAVATKENTRRDEAAARSLELRVETLSREARDREAALAASQLETAALGRQVSDLTGEVANELTARRKVTEAASQVATSSTLAEALTAEVQELRSRLDAATQSTSDLEAQLATIRSDVVELRAERDGLFEQWDAADRDLALTRSEADRLREQVATLAATGSGSSDTAVTAPIEGTGHVLSEAFAVLVSEKTEPRTAIEAIDLLLRIAPDSSELIEHRGILLSRAGRDEDAVAALAQCSDLGSAGATALVMSSLRLKQLPEPTRLVSDVDWTDQRTFDGALAAAGRLPPNVALQFGILLSQVLPVDDAGRYFETLSDRRLEDAAFAELFEVWREIDPAGAARAIVALAERGRVQPEVGWVLESMRLALGAGSRGDRLKAVKVLLHGARRRRDANALVELIDLVLLQLEGPDVPKALDEIFEAYAAIGDAATATPVVEAIFAARSRGNISSSRASELLRPLLGWVSIELQGEIRLALPEDAAGPTTPRAMPAAVTSVIDAVDAVAVAYPVLTVLEEARESARKCHRSNVAKLYAALQSLGDVAEHWRAGELPAGFDDAFRSLPFDYKGDISDTAKGRNRSSYVRRLTDGREIVLGPHIAVGNRSQILRVYMYLDRDTRTVVVGHVGEHLPDKSTG